MSVLSAAQVDEAALADWRLLRQWLQVRYLTGSWDKGIALVNAISAVAEEANHHPDLDLRYGHLNIRLNSHDVGGVTGRDIRMARRISSLAEEAAENRHRGRSCRGYPCPYRGMRCDAGWRCLGHTT